jgi:hypothetical protein
VDGKPSFEHIFRLTGFHLGAAGVGFFLAALLFAPKPREPAPLSPRVARILELRTQAHAVASAAPSTWPSPGLGVGTAGAPGSASAASAVAGPASTALARAIELCKALAWPACDPDSVRAMGKLP